MTKLQHSEQQLQVLELLNKRCKKVELSNLEVLPDTYFCLLEDQKLIEVTFSSSEDRVSVMYWDSRDYPECEEMMFNCELDNSFIDRMFEIVANDSLERLNYVRNKTYAARVQEFIKD